MGNIVLDDEYLKKLGLDGFSEDEKNALLAKFNQAIELRMGSRLAQAVGGDDRLEEFAQLVEAGKDNEAAQWIREKVPNYQEIASEELEKLTKEILDSSRSILENNI